MDFYLDGDLKATADTSSDSSRQVQQTVFSVADLPAGTHTIKAVKKSKHPGDYMLLDALKVTKGVLSSAISPTTASFDQNPSAQADLAVALKLNGNTLTSVSNGGQALQAGTDYRVTDDGVIVASSYLAKQPLGATALLFTFSGGDAQTLTVTIMNSTPVRTLVLNNDDPSIAYQGSWYRSTGRGYGDYKDDVQFAEKNGDSFSLNFRGTGIRYVTERDQSQGDVDIYVDEEFKATVGTKSDARQAQQTVYGLSGLTNGSHTFKAVKKSGNFMLLDQLIVEMPNLISLTAAEFDKADGKQADLSISLPDNEGRFSGIVNGSRTLAEGSDYTVSGNVVTISQVYLASLPAGAAQLTFQFSGDFESDIHYTANDGDNFTYSFQGTGVRAVHADES